MSKLEEREARRKQSIVGSMIQEHEATKETSAAEKTATKQKSTFSENGENKNRVQRAYWIDKDLDKALRRKSLEEDMNLTEAMNEALRRGLADYI